MYAVGDTYPFFGQRFGEVFAQGVSCGAGAQHHVFAGEASAEAVRGEVEAEVEFRQSAVNLIVGRKAVGAGGGVLHLVHCGG